MILLNLLSRSSQSIFIDKDPEMCPHISTRVKCMYPNVWRNILPYSECCFTTTYDTRILSNINLPHIDLALGASSGSVFTWRWDSIPCLASTIFYHKHNFVYFCKSYQVYFYVAQSVTYWLLQFIALHTEMKISNLTNKKEGKWFCLTCSFSIPAERIVHTVRLTLIWYRLAYVGFNIWIFFSTIFYLIEDYMPIQYKSRFMSFKGLPFLVGRP